MYEYVFNPEACACFFEYKFEMALCEGEDEFFDPFYEPGVSTDPCITKEAYDAIFVHDLGPNCLELPEFATKLPAPEDGDCVTALQEAS